MGDNDLDNNDIVLEMLLYENCDEKVKRRTGRVKVNSYNMKNLFNTETRDKGTTCVRRRDRTTRASFCLFSA